MAANLQVYSDAQVLIDGALLTEQSSVSIEKKSGLNPVFTSQKGFAGMVRGSAVCEVSIETAVPSVDFQLNPDPYMRMGRIVEVQVVMANRTTTFKGFITDATYNHSVNEASKLSMKLMCEFADFE